MRDSITVDSPPDVSITDITDRVESTVSDVESGLCSVFVRHTTASVVVNEAESRLLKDMETVLGTLVDDERTYRHDAIDDNAAAHLRSLLLGPSATVPVEDGSLDLGTWQSILLYDGDGPRTRTVTVSVVRDR